MRLYMHPVSMTSRPINLFIADNNLSVEAKVVDLMTGEHLGEEFAGINPNKLVPVLEDGDFRLTESSAILKYLADKFELHALYPEDLQKRAKVNEIMDWFNTQFYREYGYGLNYPQIFPHHKRPTDEVQEGTLQWAKGNVETWLTVLDQHFLGDGRDWLCGEKSIADYFGGCLITLGDVTRCDFSAYPNVQRWISNVKGIDSWNQVNEALYGFADAVKEQPFVAIGG